MDSLTSVVFVHGFISGARTWEAFDEVIAGDEEFAGSVEVDKFAYDTRPFQLHPLRRIPALSEVAESLRVKLVDEIPAGRAVVLVTHSMGGLVVQQYLADRVRGGTTEELASIAGVVMFSCPNEGSLLLYSARKWVSIVPMLRNRQERALRPINRQITANRKEVLNRIVHAEDPAMRIPMWLFAAESDGVVSPQSARSVFPDRFVGALPGDHFSIIRPDSVRHRSYLTLKNRVAYAITDHQRRRTPDGDQQQRPPPRAGVIDTLRPDLDTFVGRDNEVQQILAAADSARVVAVDGMAGAGKTALVTRVAHLLADRFPDGRYFLDLNGHTPEQTPAVPTDLLARLLTNLGVEPGAIPESVGARQDLWVDRVRDRRVLLVLDDALDPVQVEPLLPSGTGCLTVITSRRRLSTLDAAVTVSVDTLDPDAAAGLFSTVGGRAPADADQPAVADIVRLCGYLPLAITLLARRLASHPTWTVPALAAEFAATNDRLPHIDLDARHRAVKASFTLSYEDLPAGRQRLFRRLGLHPGPDLEAHAVAALAEIPAEIARNELDALYTDHLLDEIGPGRYRLHDLVREYAHAVAEDDPIQDRADAVDRLLAHYQTTGTKPDQPMLDWMRIERENLLACIDYTAVHSRPTQLIALTSMLTDLLVEDGPWPLAIELHQRAAETARRIASLPEAAGFLFYLGWTNYAVGEYSVSVEWYQQALDIYRQLGKRLDEADTLFGLGWTQSTAGEYSAAAEWYQLALDIYRKLGHPAGEATTLVGLGTVRSATSEYSAAAELYQRALDIYRELGDRHHEAVALYELGRTWYTIGEYSGAAQWLEQALGIYRELGDRPGEADSLYELGRTRYTIGEYSGAAQWLEQALSIYRELGDRPGEANSLYELGRACYIISEYSGAAQWFQQALDVYHELGNRYKEADSLYQLGLARNATDAYKAAAEWFQRALDIYRELGIRPGEPDSLYQLGRACYILREYSVAAEWFQQALDIYRELGNRQAEADTLVQLNLVHQTRGHLAISAELCRQAQSIYRELGDRLGEADTLCELGRVRLAVSEYSAAGELFQQVQVIYRELGDRRGEANTLHELGRVRFGGGEYLVSAELFQQARVIYREIGARLGEANTHYELGRIHSTIGEHSAAAELFQQAQAIYRELGDWHGEADIHYELGRIHSTIGEHSAAAELFQQTLAIYRELGVRPGEADTLYDLGRMHHASAEYPVSAELFQQALVIYREIGSRHGEANTLCGLGFGRYVTGNYTSAIELYQQAQAIYRAIGARLGEANALYDLGRVRFAVGEYPVSAELFQQALVIYRELGDRRGEADALYELGQACRAGSDHAGAVELYQQALNLYRELGDRQGEAKALGKLVDTPNALEKLIESRELLDSQLDSWLTQFRRE
ncbi:alpha/beta fold hydrolase [Nocardia sp. NPDC049526]|uniref:alpha/beta fold hydrolase n=1 Tax=Nocardia sp. NPDC049526 TaxID=3364316 RepID=UPI0037B8DE36